MIREQMPSGQVAFPEVIKHKFTCSLFRSELPLLALCSCQDSKNAVNLSQSTVKEGSFLRINHHNWLTGNRRVLISGLHGCERFRIVTKDKIPPCILG